MAAVVFAEQVTQLSQLRVETWHEGGQTAIVQ